MSTMIYDECLTQPADSPHSVGPTWFDTQRQKWPNKTPLLRGWLDEEIEALQAFHDSNKNAEETAVAITRPISSSPVPDLGTYSDETVALNDLWRVIIIALVEWPATRTPDLLALLEAIARIPSKIHNGEASDDTGTEPLQWAEFPYFGMAWAGLDSLQPGQICRRYTDPASLASAQRVYLKIQDIEAQCVAKKIMGWTKEMIRYIIRTLEKEIDESDKHIATDEATAFHQIKLDFNLPAIVSWFHYNGHEIYRQVVQVHLRGWTDGETPREARDFQQGSERWSFWKQRLAELATSCDDDNVTSAAQASLKYMAEIDTVSTS